MGNPAGTTGNRVAQRMVVHGTVQGVGFRPFVYREACGLGLDGLVRNDDGRVVIEAAGPAPALDALATRIRTGAPPHAVVAQVDVGPLACAPVPGSGFSVRESAPQDAEDDPGVRRIPPDLATCPACLAELFDPANRRYRYPFVNCTDCGPRATIVDDLPYDRSRTTMRDFPLCTDCAAEYHDPADRRFHAEPIACAVCGPHLRWTAGPETCVDDALRTAEDTIRTGGIVALKGLGGYQLICDATSDPAVARLRAHKHRPAKPFAVMVRNVARARALTIATDSEIAALASVARPIVLLDPSPGALLSSWVSGAAPRLGLFLPTTPLHHLLLADLDRPLVVTSGNRAEQPIAIDDAEAVAQLRGIADGFLAHDRPIRSRYDDSVVTVVGVPRLVRRARGYAPDPIPLPIPATAPLLAVGAQLKHTFALAEGELAVVGPHTGDLEQQTTLDAFETNLTHLSRVTGIEPRIVTHDRHPGYLSTQFATTFPADRRIPVQHHHAHVASCAAEHGITGPFVGVAYDGLGFGDDGTLWGGEILIGDLAGYRRVGRFGRAPLPGGEAAVRRPARMALGYLFGAENLGGAPGVAVPAAVPFLRRLPEREVRTIVRMVRRGVNSPLASSAGRLFDAVAALLGLGDDVSYEGEAAVALEAAAARSPDAGELPWRIVRRDEVLVYDPRPTLAAVCRGLAEGTAPDVLAARFHRTIVAVTIDLCTAVAASHHVRTVCLSGGVLQNRILAESLCAQLARAGLEPLLNERVPANDGGISYGQAAVAAAVLRREGP